jgi:short subunit dehydrogenase-like uncharacterized protein
MSAPTGKQLAARHVQRLRTIRKQLLEMSSQWDELDQFNMNQLEELADQAEQVAVDLIVDSPRKD